MLVHVRYFAAAREAVGQSEESVELPADADVAALIGALATRHPALAPVLAKSRIAVGLEFAAPSTSLSDGAEAAVIPPVSGGSGPRYRVSKEVPSLDAAVRSVSGPDAGGIATFTGLVRGRSQGREVVRLEYEAFGAMAEHKLAEIGAECAAQWPGARVSILHRVGTLVVGETAVVIAAAAPHRAEAFAACRHAIERLKQDVPIWKREVFVDGSSWVGLGP